MTHEYKQLEKDFPEAHKKLTLRELREHDHKNERAMTEHILGHKESKHGLGMDKAMGEY